jgi:hypothetical protein
MMKLPIRMLVFMLLLIAAGSSMDAENGPGDRGFEFLGQQFDSDYLTMDYRLPFGGMVELRVFSDEGKLVWQNQYINRRGENRIRLKSNAFAPGNSYTIQLNYKTDVYRLDVERK